MARRTTAAEPAWGDRSKMRYLNNDVQRLDGPDKVTGRAVYTHDVRLPKMVYARFLCCPMPSAKVTSINLTPALDIRGVADAMVIRTSEDEEKQTMYLGEPVAVVAADTPELCEDAVRAIEVEYEELPWVVTREQALADDAPSVHEEGNARRRRERVEGEVDAAWDECAATFEGTFDVPVQHHICLETHGHVIDYRGPDGLATVYGSTQSTFALLEAADEEYLDHPSEKVVGTVQHMGGGFGAKFSMGIEGLYASKLAKRLGRPVHLMVQRSDEFLMAGNRSGNFATVKAGATAEGKLHALESESDKLGGLSRGSYPGLPYIYEVANYRTANQSVHTNTDGNRAMRAPGHPQASFAMETIVDELAYRVGIDPLEFRKRNLSDEVYHRQLDRVAKEIGWEAHPHKTAPGPATGEFVEGIGFGVSTWGIGGGKGCNTRVHIDRGGQVTVEVGTQDLGTATRTYVTTIVAEEFGLPLERVTGHIGRTTYGRANGSGGSVTTPMLSPSVKMAAHTAREAFLAHLAPLMEVEEGELAVDGGEVAATDGTKMTWEEACAALPTEGITGNGEWEEGLSSQGVHGAQAIRVRVDLYTGAVQPLKMVCIQDVGLPLNRLALRSQINGGMIQALSYGLYEQRIIDPWLGLALSANLEDYKVAGSMEMPEMVAIIDDDDIERGPCGVGEPPVIPGHSALANAIYNACGVRLTSMPFTPDKVLNELVAMRAKGGAK